MSNSVNKVNVGIIGCGNISPVYFQACHRLHILNLVGCADMDPSRAQARADEYKTQAFGVDQLLAHPDVHIIINLTIPRAHGTVGIAALEAGKSVYNEKPLALTREEGQRMLAIAEQKGLRVGGAPDTFMGAGIQTCRKLIDDGAIGQPIGATAFMMVHGHESWHPDPEFYYQPGGGPIRRRDPRLAARDAGALDRRREIGASTGAEMRQAPAEERRLDEEPAAATSLDRDPPKARPPISHGRGLSAQRAAVQSGLASRVSARRRRPRAMSHAARVCARSARAISAGG